MDKRVFASILAIAFLRLAPQTLQAQTNQAAPSQELLEARITKTIVFITLDVKVKGKTSQLLGTVFLVGVPDDRLPKDFLFTYLVTNRHVAQALDHCKPLNLTKTYVTMNLKEPVNGSRASKEMLKITPQNPWHFPAKPSTDLAVIRFAQFSNKYDQMVFPLEYFLTSKELAEKGVIPSDNVLTMGLFTHYPGTHGLQPLVREGILAMLPDAPMQTACGGTDNLYLADVHIIPGNSGSPIFIWPTRPDGRGGMSGDRTTFGLLGIVSGYMYEDQDLTLRPSTTWSTTVHGNSGIAIVVPAEELKDLLLSPEAIRERDESFKKTAKP